MKTAINQWLIKAKVWLQDEKGLGLVESLAAVAILGIAAVAFVAALSTESIVVRQGDQEVMAQSLVQAQLEYVKGYPYDFGATTYPHVYTYDAIYNPNPVTLPEGYIISVGVDSVPDTDTDIQKITVIISRDGEDILTVEDHKVNR
ncbi:unnamed protein product [marine sediment metagenome]|uniref:Type II secretion system protein GspG C-terminal domain-containing protein n=1 Tax=marine sediment metagenome TaxID=412755 RepID=X1J7D3_9ZZZZ